MRAPPNCIEAAIAEREEVYGHDQAHRPVRRRRRFSSSAIVAAAEAAPNPLDEFRRQLARDIRHVMRYHRTEAPRTPTGDGQGDARRGARPSPRHRRARPPRSPTRCCRFRKYVPSKRRQPRRRRPPSSTFPMPCCRSPRRVQPDRGGDAPPADAAPGARRARRQPTCRRRRRRERPPIKLAALTPPSERERGEDGGRPARACRPRRQIDPARPDRKRPVHGARSCLGRFAAIRRRAAQQQNHPQRPHGGDGGEMGP